MTNETNLHVATKLAEITTSEVPQLQSQATISLEEILDKVVALYKKYFILTEHQFIAIALWIVHTYVYLASEATPYISIRSAEPSSGKTNVLYLADEIVWQSLIADNISTAALVHSVNEGCTLLIDEVDTIFSRYGDDKTKELKGILNSGYKSKGRYVRMARRGNEQYVERISSYCPKMFAGIATLPATIESRSIIINMKKKTDEEIVDDFFIFNIRRECAQIKAELERWAVVASTKLKGKVVETPKGKLEDRARECWMPLLAIAEMASKTWHSLAWETSLALSGKKKEKELTIGAQLLADIKAIFKQEALSHMLSAELISKLNDIEESPWGNWGKGSNGMNAKHLANLLKPYGIKPYPYRVGEKTLRGYSKVFFVDAWTRYVPPTEDEETSETSATSGTNHDYELSATKPVESPDVSDKPQARTVPTVAGVAGKSLEVEVEL